MDTINTRSVVMAVFSTGVLIGSGAIYLLEYSRWDAVTNVLDDLCQELLCQRDLLKRLANDVVARAYAPDGDVMSGAPDDDVMSSAHAPDGGVTVQSETQKHDVMSHKSDIDTNNHLNRQTFK